MGLPPGFKLSKATNEDQENGTISALNIAAMKSNPAWPYMINEEFTDEKCIKWRLTHTEPRQKMPDYDTYVIVEESSGRYIAYTALQKPWKHVPEMTPELKEKINSEGKPPCMEGMRHEVFDELLNALSFSTDHGYNPEHDYHRRGTMVHPDFQRRGFGTYLTQYCNKVADETGDRTWAPSGPAAVETFRRGGFKEIAVTNSHLERWGGTEEAGKHVLLLRNPGASM